VALVFPAAQPSRHLPLGLVKFPEPHIARLGRHLADAQSRRAAMAVDAELRVHSVSQPTAPLGSLTRTYWTPLPHVALSEPQARRSKAARGHRHPVSSAPLTGGRSAPKPHTSGSLTNPRTSPAPSPAETAGEAAEFQPAAPPPWPKGRIAKIELFLRSFAQTEGMVVRF
jgi:hypothetical protein